MINTKGPVGTNPAQQEGYGSKLLMNELSTYKDSRAQLKTSNWETNSQIHLYFCGSFTIRNIKIDTEGLIFLSTIISILHINKIIFLKM